MSATVPPHVVEYLRSIGRIDPDGISRKANVNRCKNCRQFIAIGLDHDKCAMVARVELQPLSPIGEAQALLLRLPTFELSWLFGRYLIDWRSPWHLQARRAGQLRGADVVAEHRCGGFELAGAESCIPPLVRPKEIDVCPF